MGTQFARWLILQLRRTIVTWAWGWSAACALNRNGCFSAFSLVFRYVFFVLIHLNMALWSCDARSTTPLTAAMAQPLTLPCLLLPQVRKACQSVCLELRYAIYLALAEPTVLDALAVTCVPEPGRRRFLMSFSDVAFARCAEYVVVSKSEKSQ